MFGMDFSKLVVIFVIALIALGPNRMPGLVRTVGRWVGKARAMANQFREQLESEIELHDLNSGTKKSAPASTPAPLPELTGAPAAANEPASEQGGNYPYGSYPYAEAPAVAPAPPPAPQPGDDTYSHAHDAGEAPTPYYPPEAEGFHTAPPPVALDAPSHPDHAAPISGDESVAANHPAGRPKDGSAA